MKPTDPFSTEELDLMLSGGDEIGDLLPNFLSPRQLQVTVMRLLATTRALRDRVERLETHVPDHGHVDLIRFK